MMNSNLEIKRTFDNLVLVRNEMDLEVSPGLAAHSGKGEHTMQQLLKAGESLFAERGFRGTSIRDIAAKAGSNLAAVNYHFGSKENLYREVFRLHIRDFHERGIRAVQELMESNPRGLTVESVLKTFAQRAGSQEGMAEARTFALLISRELVEPQLPPGFLLKEALEPMEQVLVGALSVTCPGLDRKTLGLCVDSFLGQLWHLQHMQVYLGAGQVAPVRVVDPAEAVRHIVRFTGAGIRAIQEESE